MRTLGENEIHSRSLNNMKEESDHLKDGVFDHGRSLTGRSIRDEQDSVIRISHESYSRGYNTTPKDNSLQEIEDLTKSMRSLESSVNKYRKQIINLQAENKKLQNEVIIRSSKNIQPSYNKIIAPSHSIYKKARRDSISKTV